MQRKGPLPGEIFVRCIPERRFAGLFGYTARISCQSQLVLDTWRANLAREGRFSRPGPLRGCMERKNCHGKASENELQSHLASKSSTSSRERVQDARFCHVSPEPIRGMRRCPAAAMRAAAMEESGRGVIGARGCRLRSGVSVPHCPPARGGGHWYARPAGARGGIGHFAFSGFNCQEQLRVCAVSVGNHEPTSRSAKLCRIMG